MRLSSKHRNAKTMIRADFSGGLNCSTNPDGIKENQLAVCENMEVDHSTGRLKTVAGTKELIKFSSGTKIIAAAYDEINRKILVVLSDKSLYAIDASKQTIDNMSYVIVNGSINGELYPISAAWEDGLLIATGDKLQYFDGLNLKTISTSPDKCTAVYVRAGRVVVTDEKNVRYSGVGDEENWTERTNDDSTSKFLEVGYKDGGEVIGMISLSQDIMFIKNNRHVYRLAGEFPQWTLNEVSRNVECAGRLSFCSVADAVFILGRNEVQVLQTVEQYGAVKPNNVAILVKKEIQQLPPNAKVRFIPPLEQVWFIGTGGNVLFYDLVTKSWFKRIFNSEVVDVISIGDNVYIVKPDRISKLDEDTFYDNGEPMRWKFQGQRMISQYDYFLKRTQVSVIPMSAELYAGQISVGAVRVPLPIPSNNIGIFGNQSPVYKNQTKVPLRERQRYVYTKGEPVIDNISPVCGSNDPVFTRQTYIKESRNVYRSKILDIKGFGEAGGFLLNHIIFDVAEV